MNAGSTQERDSARRDNTRGRRSCFVAKCEDEETNLGMWNDKKNGRGDNTTSDLYSRGVG